MNKKQKFESFLESLKGHGQDSLIESAKKGFYACLEADQLHETDESTSEVAKLDRNTIQEKMNARQKPIYNLGDADPYTYGGYFIYAENPKYNNAVYWEEPVGDKAEIYRFDVEKDAIKDLDWVDDWDKIADSIGTTKDEILRMGISDDIRERAEVYRSVGLYHGWLNLDGYPIKFTIPELMMYHPIEETTVDDVMNAMES